MTYCLAIQQSDEMYCASCNLRWDAGDPSPPACRRPEENSTDEGDPMSVLAKGYNELLSLYSRQRSTTAMMLRYCIARLRHPDSRKRQEAIDGLEILAGMLERKS